MPYTVLARKYRSQTFDEVIGQDPITRTLKNAIKSDRVAHAYLFTGTRGVGKTTMARILAKALNCLAFDAPTTEPCCRCDSCKAINIGEDIDVIEIDGASNNGVQEVRRLRENAIYRPARCRFKIYIVDEVHMLSNSAFNALLKILEEPPSHVKFIFATTVPNKVIPTIQSRCQRFDFRNISARLISEQLCSILQQEKIEYHQDLILPLAKMANGSMRDALSLLDRLISTGCRPLTADLLQQYLGCPDSEQIYNLIDEIGDSNAAGTIKAVQELIETGLGEVQVLDSLTDYMRDLILVKTAGTDSEILVLTDEQKKLAAQLAQKFDVAALVYNITALEKLRWTVKNSDNPRALLDALLVRFALNEHFINVDQLLSKLPAAADKPIKKKQTAPQDQAQPNTDQSTPTAHQNQPELPQLNDLQAVKENWTSVLKIIGRTLGPGTVGLLRSAVPSGFENGVLTLAFPANAEVQKNMCESNGRIKQVQSLLTRHSRGVIKLQFEISAEQQSPADSGTEQVGAATRKKNELINDPAVKAVLLGLDATITAIDEDK